MVWDVLREEMAAQIALEGVLHACFSSSDRLLVLVCAEKLAVFDCSSWERVATVQLDWALYVGKRIGQVLWHSHQMTVPCSRHTAINITLPLSLKPR